MEIVEYRNNSDLDVLFEDGTLVTNKNYPNFTKGKILNKNYDYGRVGEIIYNRTQNERMEIIEYNNSSDIKVKFNDGTVVNSSYRNFKNGGILNHNLEYRYTTFNNRINEEIINKYGTKVKIIEYFNANNITVQFQDNFKYETKTTYWAFKNDSVKNPYDKTVYNIGYLGVGDYKPQTKSIKSDEYVLWKSILNRCYGANNKRLLCYKNVTMCEEWHNFQNFARWYNENYYEIEGENTELDKDILIKGNKIYSPQTCLFVPKRINILFVKNKDYRNGTCIGVIKSGKKYVASINIMEKGNSLIIGRYNTELEAFNAYKEYKEKYIKQVADKYKDKIPHYLYKIMYDYTVEFTD